MPGSSADWYKLLSSFPSLGSLFPSSHFPVIGSVAFSDPPPSYICSSQHSYASHCLRIESKPCGCPLMVLCFDISLISHTSAPRYSQTISSKPQCLCTYLCSFHNCPPALPPAKAFPGKVLLWFHTSLVGSRQKLYVPGSSSYLLVLVIQNECVCNILLQILLV